MRATQVLGVLAGEGDPPGCQAPAEQVHLVSGKTQRGASELRRRRDDGPSHRCLLERPHHAVPDVVTLEITEVPEVAWDFGGEEVQTMTDGRVTPKRRRVEARVLAAVVSVDVAAFNDDGRHPVSDRDFDQTLQG